MIPHVQSLHMHSPGEMVRAKPPQNHHDELLPITPPPIGKTTRRELSPTEKGMAIAPFCNWFLRKISIVSLNVTGRPWKTV